LVLLFPPSLRLLGSVSHPVFFTHHVIPLPLFSPAFPLLTDMLDRTIPSLHISHSFDRLAWA
jgi:hypothetical protein